MTRNTIYVPLLDKGLEVWRPVRARRLSPDTYLILEQEYDRDIETWAYEPGTVVESRRELRKGRELMMAARAVERNETNSGAQKSAERARDACRRSNRLAKVPRIV